MIHRKSAGLLMTLTLLLLSLSVFVSQIVHAQNQTTTADQQIAFVSNEFGNDDIFVMPQAGEEIYRRRLTTSENNEWNPKWSPDGRRILFNSDRNRLDQLYMMNSDGTNVVPLLPESTSNDYDGNWSPDGSQIVFISDITGLGHEIFIVSSSGGTPQQITDFKRIVGDPSWSPDGTEILYWDQENNGEIVLYRINIDTKQVARVSFSGQYNGAAIWSAATDLIYYDTERDNHWHVYQVLPNGNNARPIVDGNFNSGRVTLSPDGQKIVFVTDRDESDEIYIMNVDGTGLIRLTRNQVSDHSPSWQPIVPENVATVVEATPETEAEATPTVLTVAVGQSVGGVETFTLTIEGMLQTYGISQWHDQGWRGAGIRIGVIDTAFGGLDNYLAGSETIRSVTLYQRTLAEYSNNNNQHGRHVIELIHRVVPEAEISACQYDGTYINFENCVDWLVGTQRVQIINHSVAIPTLPLDGTNVWAQKVDTTFDRNVLWVNSVGNFKRGYAQDIFTDRDEDNIHDFTTIDNRIEDGITVDIGSGSYTGNIFLSWEESEFAAQEGFRTDLDLQIVTAGGEVLNLTQGNAEQVLNPNLPPVEQVYLTNVTEPFKIQVINHNPQAQENPRFVIFAEYAAFQNISTVNAPSVVAPADSFSSLSIGSVNANGDLAAYSSFGRVNPDYSKPDFSTLGEIILGDGATQFIGTSAAAPVTSGMLGLLIQSASTDKIDQLRYDIPRNSTYITNMGSESFGRGIFRLPPPPYNRDLGLGETVPPKTVFPQPPEPVVVDTTACPGTVLESRLEVGVPGYVNFNLGLAIRAEPGGNQFGSLEFGQRFLVIGGPACLAGTRWWQIDLDITGQADGGQGWVAESDNYYYITPSNLERAQLPREYDTECPNALDPRLAIGDTAIVDSGSLFFFRDEGRAEQINVLMPSGSEVYILGGPVCQGANQDALRWYVRVLTGRADGLEGWYAEGDEDTRAMRKIDS